MQRTRISTRKIHDQSCGHSVIHTAPIQLHLIVFALAIATLSLVCKSATAATINLTASDDLDTTSFNTGLHWANGLPPSSLNSYIVSALTLRTPPTGGNRTFAGGSLLINGGGVLAFKGFNGNTITVNNLTLDNGQIGAFAGGGPTFSMAGKITLGDGGGVLNTAEPNRGINVTAPISGSGGLSIVAEGTAYLSGANTYAGATTISGGTLVIDTAGALPANGAVVNNALLYVRANTIAGSISGTGITKVDNGVVLTADSFAQSGLIMEVGANSAAGAQLHVNSNLTLGGALTVNFANGFMPAVGNSFDLLDWGTINGTFSTVALPGLSPGLAWNTTQLYASGRLSIFNSSFLPGDFNRDSHVNAADISVMMNVLADANPYKAILELTDAQFLSICDLNADSLFSNADLQSLLVHIAAGGGSNSAVPEPSLLALLIAGTVTVCGCAVLKRSMHGRPDRSNGSDQATGERHKHLNRSNMSQRFSLPAASSSADW